MWMNKTPIKDWMGLALAYHKGGKISCYQRVLKEALGDQDVHLDGSNQHMFEDKKARHDAMNSLASFSF